MNRVRGSRVSAINVGANPVSSPKWQAKAIKNIMRGRTSITPELLAELDFNKDGAVNNIDLSYIRRQQNPGPFVPPTPRPPRPPKSPYPPRLPIPTPTPKPPRPTPTPTPTPLPHPMPCFSYPCPGMPEPSPRRQKIPTSSPTPVGPIHGPVTVPGYPGLEMDRQGGQTSPVSSIGASQTLRSGVNSLGQPIVQSNDSTSVIGTRSQLNRSLSGRRA